MTLIGNIFGPGRKIDKLLKKAEDSFGHGDWEQCAQVTSNVLALIDPENPGKFSNELLRAYYLNATAHFKAGNIDQALEVIEEGLRCPDGLADIAKLLSEVVESTDNTKAIELLELAVKKLPNNNFIAFTLCDKYTKLKKFDDKSLPLFSRMHQRALDNKEITYGLAMCYRNLGKYDRTALAVYRKAFNEFSTNKDFLYGLARTYASQKTVITEALPVIERALKFFPDEELFHQTRIVIMAGLPSLTSDQVRILMDHFKKTKDKELAGKLIGHLLATHADDEDACRVYELMWPSHSKRTTILSILSEKYRLAGRKDEEAMKIFQAFFDEMPREHENSLNLARRYAENGAKGETPVIVFQQALRDNVSSDVDNVVLALAKAYMTENKITEEAGRIYRMAHAVEPEKLEILSALKEVVMKGGRIDGSRANALIKYIKHPEPSEKEKKEVAVKLGVALAEDGRSDEDALNIYRTNIESRKASNLEEDIFASQLIKKQEAKTDDIKLIEKVYVRKDTNEMALSLARLYLKSGQLSKKRLPVVLRAMKLVPSDKELGNWVLPYLFNKHGNDENSFGQLAEIVGSGHLSGAKGINPGAVAQTITRIARDRIRDGNFKEAIGILIEAFKYEKNPILQYLLGVSYQGSGDTQTGLGIFKNLMKSEKTNPAYSYRIAVLKLMSGDVGEADKELKSLAKQYNDHPLLCLRFGMIDESRGHPFKAMEQYEMVKSGDKSVIAFADYRKGIIRASLEKWEEAHKLLGRAAGGGITNQTMTEALLISTVKLADMEIDANALYAAESHLVTIVGNRIPPWLQIANERFLRLGILRLLEGDNEGAQRVLELGEKTGIRDARVSGLISMIDFEAGKPKASVDRLERYLTLRDKIGEEFAHKLWAVISMRLGKHDEAREAADWLLAHESKDAARLRFLSVWRNPIEVDWPASLGEYSYDYLEKEFGFPVGLIGRMAYKFADYEAGAKYLENYFKDESKPDRVEAEFLLGLMYIKLKKPNLGLHYWSEILSEGYKELEGKHRVHGLMLLGFHFLEHGEPEKSREAFKLAGDAGASKEEIERAVSFSHIQAGYLAAKVDNMLGAIMEWETILENDPDNWQALQNLGLAYFWTENDEKSLEYFNRLFVVCDTKPELIFEDDFSFVIEETRKMVNQLVDLIRTKMTRNDVKREMLMDEIKSANRHYWTLGVKKGTTSENAQANYFRLVKIYNPEKYPQDFMTLEKGYQFFNKPGLIKKNEQRVFNAFHFRQLGMEETEGLTEIPPSSVVVEFLRKQLDPRNNVDLEALLKESFKRKENIPDINMAPDFSVPDYLASW